MSITMTDFIKALVVETNKTEEQKTMDLETAIETFIAFKKNKVKAPTISFYRIHLKQVYNYLSMFKVTQTNQIDKNILIQFQHEQLRHGVKPQTINKRVTCILLMLKELQELDFISYQRIEIKHLVCRDTEIEVVEENNIKRVLNYASTLCDNSNLCIQLLITTGIRTNELIQIKNANIYLDKKYIVLTETKSGYKRIAPLVEDIIPLLEKVKSDRKYLFSKNDLEHFKPSFVRSLIARVKKTLKIDVLSPHKLRHSYATYHCRNGTNLKVLQELLGHRSILMTQKYIDIDKEDLIKANNDCNMLTELKKNTDTRQDT